MKHKGGKHKKDKHKERELVKRVKEVGLKMDKRRVKIVSDDTPLF